MSDPTYETHLSECFAESELIEIGKNRLVYYRNEVPRTVRLIMSGTVRLYTLNANEIERNIALLDAGDVLPVECILGKDKSCRYFYETIAPTTFKEMNTKTFRDTIGENSDIMAELFEQASRGYVGSLVQIEAFGQPKVREKILYILRYLLANHGHKGQDGWWEVNVRLTHNDIANMIGIARETVAVEMKKLKEDGIVNYRTFRYSLNLPQLIDSTGSQDWKEFLQ